MQMLKTLNAKQFRGNSVFYSPKKNERNDDDSGVCIYVRYVCTLYACYP